MLENLPKHMTRREWHELAEKLGADHVVQITRTKLGKKMGSNTTVIFRLSLGESLTVRRFFVYPGAGRGPGSHLQTAVDLEQEHQTQSPGRHEIFSKLIKC